MLTQGTMLHVTSLIHVDKRCNAAGHPNFCRLTRCANSCIHVKKAHSRRNLTKADSSEGMLPEILLSLRYLQCKQV